MLVFRLESLAGILDQRSRPEPARLPRKSDQLLAMLLAGAVRTRHWSPLLQVAFPCRLSCCFLADNRYQDLASDLHIIGERQPFVNGFGHADSPNLHVIFLQL